MGGGWFTFDLKGEEKAITKKGKGIASLGETGKREKQAGVV